MRTPLLAALLLAPVVVAPVYACNASPAQVDASITAGVNLASCVLSEVLGGITDPAQLLTCAGATEALIVQIIDDFIAQRPADAGLAAMGPGVTPQQRQWLQQARQNAVAAMASHASSK